VTIPCVCGEGLVCLGLFDGEVDAVVVSPPTVSTLVALGEGEGVDGAGGALGNLGNAAAGANQGL